MKDLTLPTLEKVIAEKSASAKRGQKEAAVAFVTYDGAAADLNELARYVDRLENAARAALSHHEDAGQADVGGLGGEKGEAVAHRYKDTRGHWRYTGQRGDTIPPSCSGIGGGMAQIWIKAG